MPNEIQVKSVLNKTKQRDPWFLDDYTINPYSGCSFNCLYCYIRGSKYGIHMEEKTSIKINAFEILEKQLATRANKNQYGIIVLSSATDPYLHFEKEYQLTRRILELILKYKFPVHIITKSDLVTRDFDLLHQINEQAILPSDLASRLDHKALITFSFSTLDKEIAAIFELGAPTPQQRLETVKATLNAGFFSGISLMPLLPFISDTEEALTLFLHTFSSLKINYIFPAPLTLFGSTPSDSLSLVFRAIEKYNPSLLPYYKNLFTTPGSRLKNYHNEFYQRFKKVNQRFGLKQSIL